MSADDTDDGESDEDPLTPEGDGDPLGGGEDPLNPSGEDGESPQDRLEGGADRAIESFDEGVIDLLSWMLDTDTKARIYVFLRQHPDSTSKEVAEGTGLYPSTVREALAELHDEEVVTRQKRQSEGAGNNPYEYAAIKPSELVGTAVDAIQHELNAVFNLDEEFEPDEEAGEPVTITVQDRGEESGDDESDADGTAIDVDEDREDDAEGGDEGDGTTIDVDDGEDEDDEN